MKDLSVQELDMMLCSTGYLPPRSEEEYLFFVQMYEGYKPRLGNKHVDVEAIINGACSVEKNRLVEPEMSIDLHVLPSNFAGYSYSMAARNYDKLPKEILAKMKKQHETMEDDED